MSEIRQLLAAAQHAELQGNLTEATRLLHDAADWYQQRNLAPRAEQMRRHIDRLRDQLDPPPSVPGAIMPRAPMPRAPMPRGLLDQASALPDGGDQVWDLGVDENSSSIQALTQQRRPVRAPTETAAWCSFCCRPNHETGPLVAGPQGAGAFICAECVGHSSQLLDQGPASPPQRPVPVAQALLPQQARAAERLRARKARVALVTGPEATGKSMLVRHFGGPHAEPWPDTDLLALDLAEGLNLEVEARLLAWLDQAPQRQLLLAMRGVAPTPALVLQGLHGPEPLYDSLGLKAAAPVGSEALLTRIDLVIALEAPGHAELEALAQEALKQRGVEVSAATRRQLIDLAQRTSRPAAELVALVNRIPPGSYQAP